MRKIARYVQTLPLVWHRVGRTMLFSLTLFASPYLPLGLGSPQDNGTWATIAYFYSALVVFWGLWKPHGVIGWSCSS